MKYQIDQTKRPVYLQIYQQLRDDIVRGILPAGSKLPSKRLLADELGVSTITIEHTYALLCEEGYIKAKERSGYFVIFQPSDGFAISSASPCTLSLFRKTDQADTEKRYVPSKNTCFSSQNPKNNSVSAFPLSLLSKTMRRVLSNYQDVILEKSPNTGCLALRGALQQYLARNRGIQAEAEQIIIGSGAEYLCRLIVDLLGRDKIYAIESPSYEKIEQVYRAAGVVCEPLPLSTDGIDSSALAKSRADILHTTPYRSFPSGVTASASKRHEYIRWSNQGERFLVESDYDSEFSVSSKPAETLFSLSSCENVIYVNTFSKTISPSLRVGYMVLPKRLVTLFQQRLGFYSCTVPTFEQYVLAELINNGDFERHINRVRRAMRKELD